MYQDLWYWLFIVDVWVLHVNGTAYRSAMLAKRNGRNGLEIGNILIYSGCLEVSRREVVWCKGQPSKMGALRATRSRAVSVRWVAFWAWRCSQKWAWWVSRDEALLCIQYSSAKVDRPLVCTACQGTRAVGSLQWDDHTSVVREVWRRSDIATTGVRRTTGYHRLQCSDRMHGFITDVLEISLSPYPTRQSLRYVHDNHC